MSENRVREAHSEDARAIAEAHVRAWQDAYHGQMPDEYLDGLSADDRVEPWRKLLAESDRKTWVAERGEIVVGFATAGPSRDEDADGSCGELFAINLVAQAWGTGLGTALLEAATEYLQQRGFTSATLWVLDTNARARRFYEREGWQLDGATKTDEERGFPLKEVRYRIEL